MREDRPLQSHLNSVLNHECVHHLLQIKYFVPHQKWNIYKRPFHYLNVEIPLANSAYLPCYLQDSLLNLNIMRLDHLIRLGFSYHPQKDRQEKSTLKQIIKTQNSSQDFG